MWASGVMMCDAQVSYRGALMHQGEPCLSHSEQALEKELAERMLETQQVKQRSVDAFALYREKLAMKVSRSHASTHLIIVEQPIWH